MFLVLVNEALGYTHQQTLDSSLSLVISMLREHGYMMNERNRYIYGDEEDAFQDAEWITTIDFDTGQPRRVRKVDSF